MKRGDLEIKRGENTCSGSSDDETNHHDNVPSTDRSKTANHNNNKNNSNDTHISDDTRKPQNDKPRSDCDKQSLEIMDAASYSCGATASMESITE